MYKWYKMKGAGKKKDTAPILCARSNFNHAPATRQTIGAHRQTSS